MASDHTSSGGGAENPPRPFIPESKPGPDEYFLTFEFIPLNPVPGFDPASLAVEGTEYHLGDGRIAYRSPFDYDAFEFSSTLYRYTLSVPSPRFVTLEDYFETAQENIRTVLPECDQRCTVRIYLTGKNALEHAPESGISEFASTFFEVDDTRIEPLDETTDSVVIFTPQHTSPVHL